MSTIRSSRKKEVFIKKCILAVFTLVFLFTGIIFTNKKTSRSHAASSNSKYFTSIEVHSGDTLWNIAEQYMTDDYSTKQEFVDEVIKLNHLSSDGNINSGCFIIVPYYSATPLS